MCDAVFLVRSDVSSTFMRYLARVSLYLSDPSSSHLIGCI